MLKINNLAGRGKPATVSAEVNPANALYVWGDNADGQLGMGDTTRRNTPTLNSAITKPAFVDFGGSVSRVMFLKDNGTVKSAGFNASGQLGDGTTANKTSFVTQSNPSDIYSGARDISIESNGGSGSWSLNFGETDIGLSITGNGELDWGLGVASWNWVRPDESWISGSGTMQMTSPPSVGGSNAGAGAVGIYIPSLDVEQDPEGDPKPLFISNLYDILDWGSDRVGRLVKTGNFERSASGGTRTEKIIAASPTTRLTLQADGSCLSYSSNNQYGEVGRNASIGEKVGLGLLSPGPATDIAGNEFNSFVLVGGKIFACGSGQTGCTGPDSRDFEFDLVQLGAESDWVEIQAGEACLVARNSSNELHFIGNNSFAQKGVSADGITTAFTRIGTRTYESYTTTARSVYAIEE